MMKLEYFVALVLLTVQVVKGKYLIGTGIADCTGPVAEVTLMGYAKLGQIGCGLHLRQFSRAYIVDDGTNRTAFITIDAQSAPHGLRREVLKKLKEKYDDTYTDKNLILSGTHTHGAPGGFCMDLLLDISIFGFVPETFNVLVAGITQSLINAHESMVEGKIFVNSGELLDANINRSPASYLFNPQEERDKYKHDVDKEMVQVKFVRSSDNVAIGAVNWFPIHGTSMNNTNCLVTSDNVGYASILFEEHVNNGNLPGKGPFVGAFASTNLGDVSPNTRGPICINTGKPCDFNTSTCDGDAQYCIASGPGNDIFESTEIIANRLFNKAKEIFHEEGTFEVTGPIKFIHQYVDMPQEKITVTLTNGTKQEVQGCTPAMGYSFAGGTTDGPGDFDFTQGTITDNPFWDAVRDFVFPPTPEQVDCHHPKPILINTGGVSFPYQWQTRIVSTQIVLIGDLALIAVPGEFTTMSGRRLRSVVKEAIISNGGSKETHTIITGLSNDYTSYIATPEEYQLQRYEGGSTIFGPWTLDIYLNKYKQLASALIKDEKLDDGPTPLDFTSKLVSLVPLPSDDSKLTNQSFGDCVLQPPKTAKGGDIITVKFVSGNPRHSLLKGGSFLTVDKQIDNTWTTVANDGNWETRYHWKRTTSTMSEVTIEWLIREDVIPGTYRITHNGHYKNSGVVKPYGGITETIIIK